MFKQACYLATSHCNTSLLSTFIQYTKTGREYLRQGRKSEDEITEEDTHRITILFSKPKIIISMKTSKTSPLIFVLQLTVF